MKGRTIELKVRRFGNSLGVVLPKDVINRLQATKGAPVFAIELDDGDYRLTSSNPAFAKKIAKAEEVMKRYRDTLHALAR